MRQDRRVVSAEASGFALAAPPKLPAQCETGSSVFTDGSLSHRDRAFDPAIVHFHRFQTGALMLVPVVMADGIGSRLWPVSREHFALAVSGPMPLICCRWVAATLW